MLHALHYQMATMSPEQFRFSATMSVLIALAPAHVARSKGRSFLAWWLFGTALWVVAYPWSLLLRPRPPVQSAANDDRPARRWPFPRSNRPAG